MTDSTVSNLSDVQEPMLERSLGELGMVGEVSEKRFGSDKIQVLVPVPNYPVLDELERRIRAAIGTSVALDFVAMTDEQRAAMMDGLRATSGPKVSESGSRTRVVMVS